MNKLFQLNLNSELNRSEGELKQKRSFGEFRENSRNISETFVIQLRLTVNWNEFHIKSVDLWSQSACKNKREEEN